MGSGEVLSAIKFEFATPTQSRIVVLRRVPEETGTGWIWVNTIVDGNDLVDSDSHRRVYFSMDVGNEQQSHIRTDATTSTPVVDGGAVTITVQQSPPLSPITVEDSHEVEMAREPTIDWDVSFFAQTGRIEEDYSNNGVYSISGAASTDLHGQQIVVHQLSMIDDMARLWSMHPVFYLGLFSQAVSQCLADLKPLAVYIPSANTDHREVCDGTVIKALQDAVVLMIPRNTNELIHFRITHNIMDSSMSSRLVILVPNNSGSDVSKVKRVKLDGDHLHHLKAAMEAALRMIDEVRSARNERRERADLRQLQDMELRESLEVDRMTTSRTSATTTSSTAAPRTATTTSPPAPTSGNTAVHSRELLRAAAEARLRNQ
ncbi:unnamed protein product [Owenia fusiformis]|uniref:Uncharacterized protein n=1 Tax=Owenia fusiformis TaxID=6347 RepID=A0A8S4Q4Y7_OWEFU|nr:unnamed protein product [Owenia fusiformis]